MRFSEMNDMQRRNALRAGFILVSGLAGEPLFQRYAPLPGSPIRELDPAMVVDAVARTADLGVRDTRDGAETVLNDVTRHVQRMLDALRRSHPRDPSHLGLLIAAAEAIYLLGVVIHDLHAWPTADSYFQLANRLARRVNLADAELTAALDLQAMATARRSRLLAARNRDDLAVHVLGQVSFAALSPEAKAIVHVHVALARGRAAAFNRDPSDRREKLRLSLSAFDRAEAELERSDSRHAQRFPGLASVRPVVVGGHAVPAQVNNWRGHVYTKLASNGVAAYARRAYDIHHAVLPTRPAHKHRGTGELLLDMAESAAHAGDRDRAYELAGSALDVFGRVRSRRLTARSRALVPQLGRLFGRREEPQRELERRLGELTAAGL